MFQCLWSTSYGYVRNWKCFYQMILIWLLKVSHRIKDRVTSSGDFSPKNCFKFWLLSRQYAKILGYSPNCWSVGYSFGKIQILSFFWNFWLLLWRQSGSSDKGWLKMNVFDPSSVGCFPYLRCPVLIVSSLWDIDSVGYLFWHLVIWSWELIRWMPGGRLQQCSIH